MKTYILPSLKLTGILILICSIIYPLLITTVGFITPDNGGGEKVRVHNKIIGYENIGQKFTDDNYFQGRPSNCDYNAAASGGSNKGGSNVEYLKLVQARIDTFLIHNPTIDKSEIPSDLVTASGSGLDPHISLKAAKIQVDRIAKNRNKSKKEIIKLIDELKEQPLLGVFGPEKVNVLKLNLALNKF